MKLRWQDVNACLCAGAIVALLWLVHMERKEVGIAYTRGYAEGQRAGELLETERILDMIRSNHVYLGPLEIWQDGQTVHDCIFIYVEPNDPVLNVDANDVSVLRCRFHPLPMGEGPLISSE